MIIRNDIIIINNIITKIFNIIITIIIKRVSKFHLLPKAIRL